MRNANLSIRFPALFLSVVLAMPAYALRIGTPAETGLEEDLTRELQSPNRQKSPVLTGLEEPPYGRWLRTEEDQQKVTGIVEQFKTPLYSSAKKKGPREHGTKKTLTALKKEGYYVRLYVGNTADYFVFRWESEGISPYILWALGQETRVAAVLPEELKERIDYPYLESVLKKRFWRIYQGRHPFDRLVHLNRWLKSSELSVTAAISLASAKDPETAKRHYDDFIKAGLGVVAAYVLASSDDPDGSYLKYQQLISTGINESTAYLQAVSKPNAGLEEEMAQVLGRLASGLEEGLGPEVRDLLNGWVEPSSSTTVRLYRLADQLPKLRPDQRAQFVQGLVWYSDRPEVRDLLKMIFLQGDTEARRAVRQMILTGIKEDPTGEAVDAFETLFSRLPLEEMEPVFHRVLTEINEGGVLGGELDKIEGLAGTGKRKAKWGSGERGGRSMRTEDRHGRLAVAEESPLAIALAQVNRVLFQEIQYGVAGNWKEGWEAQGPALALALEHALLFEIGRQWTEEHALSAKLEEFLYKQLRKVAKERVWLSRKTHPVEPLTDGPTIEQGFGFFYKLIAHRLHTRQREENRQILFPKHEANLARDLFLSLRSRLRAYSATEDRFLRHRVLERLVELEDDYATYLASLGNLSQKDPQFEEAALRGLSELREEFDVKMELKSFRSETRAQLGLLEPPATAGLEEPLPSEFLAYEKRLVQQINAEGNFSVQLDPGGFIETLHLPRAASLSDREFNLNYPAPTGEKYLLLARDSSKILLVETHLGAFFLIDADDFTRFGWAGAQLSAGLFTERIDPGAGMADQGRVREKLSDLLALLGAAGETTGFDMALTVDPNEIDDADLYEALRGVVTLKVPRGQSPIRVVLLRGDWVISELPPASGLEEPTLFQGMTAVGAAGEIVLAPGLLPDRVVIKGLEEGRERMVVRVADIPQVPPIYVGPGIELSEGVVTALGPDKVRKLPSQPADSFKYLAGQPVGLVLLDVPAGTERQWAPVGMAVANLPHEQAPVLTLSQLAGLEEAARVNGGIIRINRVIERDWSDPIEVYDVAA